MKLKKIASLALAGLMAVSMLAACGDNSSNGNGTVVEPGTSSSIVSAFNDEQNSNNDVKVTVTADSTLSADLAKAVKEVGYQGSDKSADVAKQLYSLNGVEQGVASNVANEFAASNNITDGKSVTKLFVVYVGSNGAWTEEAAVMSFAKAFDQYVAAKLPETSYKKGTTQVGGKYYDYSYTGTVAMTSVKNGAGNTEYYAAFTVTQTAAEKKLEA